MQVNLTRNDLVLLHTITECRLADLNHTIETAPTDEPSEVTQANLNYRYDLAVLRHKLDRLIDNYPQNCGE